MEVVQGVWPGLRDRRLEEQWVLLAVKMEALGLALASQWLECLESSRRKIHQLQALRHRLEPHLLQAQGLLNRLQKRRKKSLQFQSSCQGLLALFLGRRG